MFYYLWNKFTTRSFFWKRDRIIASKQNTELLSDEEIQQTFFDYREKVSQAEGFQEKMKLIDQFLIPVFSLVREIIHRKTGLLLFETQIFGAMVLHNANIAQMNTGEGKTLTAFLPVCLNSLAGRKVYLVTVNEYLAKRDWELAKPILDFFGITSGVNLGKLSREEKKKVYQDCQVIYTTGSELGFDYLRNHLVVDPEEKITTDYFYAIIDEADSLLLDEGMNPMIISQRNPESKTIILPEEYLITTHLANSLSVDKDYYLDEKEKEIWLKESGIKKVERFFSLDSKLFSFKNHKYNYLINNALKAKHLYRKDIDYIVHQGKLVLIDALTGRLVANRVYGAGIHQAIESKENLLVSKKSRTVATITYQNFFRLFDKLSGMTGTAESEAEEFRQVYGMEVIKVLPYRKMIRKDRSDLIFWDKESKYKNIIQLIRENYLGKKRPILIGSPSVETSEYLSELLWGEKIFHYKLNAVNHQQEAEIIAEAGQLGSITISTNMAGRGTDILLSEESRKVGGLLVIGVERNTSRRIDDQLKGRAGRQGDPGESRFYVSLEDELVKNLALKEKIDFLFREKEQSKILDKPIKNKFFNVLISEPQEMLKNLQSFNRQNVLNYDLLINRQRKIIYDYRDEKLDEGVRKKNDDNFSQEQHRKVIKLIDDFWSEYLESLSKIRSLVQVKIYLPQEPQEAFFNETINLFEKGLKILKKKIVVIEGENKELRLIK